MGSVPEKQPEPDRETEYVTSSTPALVEETKRRLVCELYLRRGTFWELVSACRTDWNLNPITELPPTTTELAPLAVFIRDLTTFVPLLMRLGFFASPVMYSVDYVPENFRWIAEINPVAVAITGVRDTMLAGEWPQWNLLGIHIAVAVCIVGVAVAYLRRIEDRLVDAL